MKTQCTLFAILLIVASAVSQFSFNTERVPHTGYFIANEEDPVVLTCSPPEGARRVRIYKVIFRQRYVDFMAITLNEHNGEYKAKIGPSTADDSTWYVCEYYIRKCSKIWGTLRCGWVDRKHVIALYVIPSSESSNDITCILLNGTNGIFFIGDDIVLRCTTFVQLEVSISEGTDTSEDNDINYSHDNDTGTLIVTIPVHREYSNATISCVRDDEDDQGSDEDTMKETNFCQNITKISVYADLEVSLIPTPAKVPNRGNVKVNCQSDLYSLASFELLIEDNGVEIGNTSISPGNGGMILNIDDIDFTNSTSFEVFCNVTVGTKGTTRKVTVSEEGVTASPAPAIIIPVIVGVVVVCVLVVIVLWYRKSSREESTKKKTKDEIKGDSPNAKNQSVNDYSFPSSKGNARLGYTSTDAKVVDNVAYVSNDSENL